MKRFAWLALLGLACVPCANAQEPKDSPRFIVHFGIGPGWKQELAPRDQASFGGRSAKLKRLRDEGTIIFGARYGDLGMVIFSVESETAVRTLLDADPGVVSGIFTYRVAPLRVFYPWKQ